MGNRRGKARFPKFPLASFLLALSATVWLCGCAGRAKRADRTPEELYRLAQDEVEDRAYEKAESMINKIRDEFPFSTYAIEAELLSADMAYKRDKWEEAAAAYRSFEELHPTHPKVPYAIFRRGLAYFELSLPADRDQTATRHAADAFQKLLFAHPNSQYAADARTRLTEARDRLAAHELYVAQYYSRKDKYDAALKRLQGLVQNYPDSRYRDEALELALKLEAKKKKAAESN
jgi:outer membrane protein assembly factor BamD